MNYVGRYIKIDIQWHDDEWGSILMTDDEWEGLPTTDNQGLTGGINTKQSLKHDRTK